MSVNLKLIKFAAQAATSIGVTKVVGDIIRNNTTILTPAQNAQVWVGSFVLTSMAVQHATNHVEHVFTQVVNWKDNLDKKDDEEPKK